MGSTGRSVSTPSRGITKTSRGYTVSVTGKSGRKSEIYTKTKAEAEKAAKRARSGGSKTRTKSGRKSVR